MIKEHFNQKVTPYTNGVTVEIFKKEPKKKESLPFSGEEFAQYLKEEEFIQFNTPLMEKTVNSIISDEKDPLIILEKIFNWIEANVTITPTISFPNTLDVLKMKQGDCGELSALLVGFLRRLGIPAYVNIGLVHLDGIFYYHAWVSMYVGEWIDTDPALRQLIADASHIKLFQGLRGQFEIPKIIGNVKINVVEYR
jgi:transglutaminase-like putative cysteine protease